MKVYIIASIRESTGDPAGLYGPPAESRERWEHPAAATSRYRDSPPEMRELVRGAVSEKYPDRADELMANYGDNVVIFLRRKDVREAVARLNEDGQWRWCVVECGEAVDRDVRPVLGWRIMYGVNVSSHNSDHPDDMFPTRKAAREYYRRHDLRAERYDDGSQFYRIEPVYGAYRVDPKYTGDTRYVKGILRFRSKANAEQFARQTYHIGSLSSEATQYRVVRHDEPVPESRLWDIEA